MGRILAACGVMAMAHVMIMRTTAQGVVQDHLASTGRVGKTSEQSKLSGSKPNVVIFFADDFGYGDLAAYGHPTQEYGNIDKMADEGIRFTQWYSAESICTPSRMGMMTGRMPTRLGMVHSVFSPTGSEALPLDSPTIAEMVKPLGYNTGIAGKWHLGLNKATPTDGLHLPYYRGFDDVGHILPFSNHWACDESGRHSPKPGMSEKTDAARNGTCFIYKNTTLWQQPIDHSTLTQSLVDDSTSFITKSVTARIPFLWYMPFPQCHVSMFTNTSFTNTSKNGIFGDQIREMDWAVGEVISTVTSLGALNNTIFFFSSDHGPHVELCLEGGTAGHLRGGKGDSSWEGGLRVPGIIYWPGMVQPSIVDAPVSTCDVFATVVDLAGGKIPTDKIYDGRSLVPMLGSTPNITSPHEALFHYCGDTLMAVRYKNYKLRYYTEQLPLDNYSTVHCTNGWAHGEFFQGGWDCHGGSVTTNNPPELLDIGNDMSERYPLLPNGSWGEYLEYLEATTPADSPLRSFRYYDDIGVLRDANTTCRNSSKVDGCVLGGYKGTGLTGTNSTDLFEQCHQQCCSDSDCAAFVLQMDSRNKGEPPGQCIVGQPCCWMVDASKAAEGCAPNASATAYAGVMEQAPPTGPYAPILREIDAIVADHLAKMVRGVVPGSSGAKLKPCGGDVDGICTINYPTENPKRT